MAGHRQGDTRRDVSPHCRRTDRSDRPSAHRPSQRGRRGVGGSDDWGQPTGRRSADLLGRPLETFVVARLRAQATLSERRCALHHLHHHNGRHEIDVISELDTGHIIAIAVKATAAPTSRDARHLAWLRDEEGDRFVAGLVLHSGPGTIPLGDRLGAVPTCALWQ